ncbi:hypothetical protein ACIQUG_22015 [Ensifer sp. NPDC090286]|uniref:hypothetical protein n=1 Tax=Ensifer sp. NPDC090286 TaxID=3363991 RepID=UPI00383B2C83
MYERYSYGKPQRTFSTGLPIGVMLFAFVVIGGYLVIGSAIVNDSNQTVGVVLPTPVASLSK